jgi:hypothetical protein
MRGVQLAFAIAVLGVALVPGAALASPPDYTWGWVTDRQPTKTHFTPAARDQGNSAGLTDTVDRSGVGNYYIHLPGLGTAPDGGTVIVTALATTPHFCISGDIGRSSPDENIEVLCYGFDGEAADSKFSVGYTAGGIGTGVQAYLWANEPTTDIYTPDPGYQFNAQTGMDDNTVARAQIGYYTATLPGVNGAEGNVQLTGDGDSNCRVASWTTTVPIAVTIKCYSVTSGALVDDRYNLMYTDNVGLTGVPGHTAAYLFANMPTTFSYTPAPAYRFSTAMAPSIKRVVKGQYVISLPGMPRGGAAEVTAVGSGKSRCQLESISTSTPQKVAVLCFAPNGSAVDSKFTFSYTK